jgi:hypothetical protein
MNDSDSGEGIKALAAVVVGLLVVALVVVGLWQIGWIFTEANTKREGKIENIKAHNVRHGYDYQQTLRGQITSGIQGIVQIEAQMIGQSKEERKALANQRLSQLATLCSEAQNVTGDPLPEDQQKFISTNCVAGAVSPSSPYQKGN